jgi:hypothetical protein
MLGSQEHYDLISQFERDFGIKEGRAKKEPKDMWPKGYVYAHGETNAVFLAYRHGYAYGKCRFQQIAASAP